jgi:hypothetical protein
MSNIQQIVSAMGARSTNGWDMVCCYNEDRVNHIFNEKYKKNTICTKVTLEGSCTLPFVGKVKFESELSLRAPKIHFSTERERHCELNMPIKGGFARFIDSKGNVDEEDIPADILQIVCYAPIAAASGDLEEIHNGSKPIVFKEDKVSQNYIFLHFKNTTETIYSIEPLPEQEPAAKELMIYQENIRSDMINAIETFFKKEVSEIDYSLGSLKNEPTAGLLSLTPKSFIFSISDSEQNNVKTPPSLNLYIQAAESGNDPGDPKPSFQPDGKVLAPIAEGFTASLIISGQFFEQLIKKTLHEYNPSSLIKHEKNAFANNLTMAGIVSCPGYHRDANHYFKGLNIDISKTRFILEVLTVPGSQGFDVKGRLTYQSEEAKGYYAHWDNCAGEMVGGEGNLYASFSITKEFPLAFLANGVIAFNVQLTPDDVKVSTKVKPVRGGWTIDEKPIEDQIKADVPKKVGKLELHMDGISTFITTNLLFPEDNYFSFKAGDKYYLPYDLIAFGYMTD